MGNGGVVHEESKWPVLYKKIWIIGHAV